MKILHGLGALNWHVIGAALISVGILHIGVTLALPGLGTMSAYQQLAARLPANTMQVLPSLSPSAQPIVFLTPEFRYAMCRIDTSGGPVSVTVNLPDRGWTVSLYSAEGESLYAATGQLGRPAEIVLQVISSDERFAGLTPEARGKPRADNAAVTVGAREGLVIVRAPVRGLAYEVPLEAEIKRASCGPAFAGREPPGRP